MLRVLFGELKGGRLKRLPFFGYWLLLTVASVGALFAIAVLIGAADRITSGGLQQLEDQLRTQFGIAGIILVIALACAISFANLNLQAKRLRDIGLPGWPAIAGIMALSFLLSLAFSSRVSGSFNIIVFLTLLLIPTGTWQRRTAAG